MIRPSARFEAVRKEHQNSVLATSVACVVPNVIEHAVHLAANAMFMADAQGGICWINAAFTRLFG